MTRRDVCGSIVTQSAHGVRPECGSVVPEGGGTVRPTLGGGCGDTAAGGTVR